LTKKAQRGQYFKMNFIKISGRCFRVFLAVLFFTVTLFPALAQTRGLTITTKDGTNLTSFSGSHALVIGESAYNNGWPPLPGVKEDVAAVKQLLEGQGFSVQTLEDKTSRALKSGIESFFDRYGYEKDVRLLIYYAGHGQTLKLDNIRDMGYIVPIDAPLDQRDEMGFKRLAISMEDFNAWATKIESRHVLFMFDSCFSGSIFAISRAAPGIIDYKIASPVRQFISSGGANEAVPDKSIFRRQLEAALRDREADVNKDGYVSGSELGEYLQTTVVNYSNNSQHPQYGKIRNADLDKGDFVFEVGIENSQELAITPPALQSPEAKPASPAAAPVPAAPIATAPSPEPKPAVSFTTGKKVGLGFMNMAFGLGSFTTGDRNGGLSIVGGYALGAGLIVADLVAVPPDDPGSGTLLITGAATLGVTVLYGFMRPFMYHRSAALAGIMDQTNIALTSARDGVKSVQLSYTVNF
jgi:hypothetical protein